MEPIFYPETSVKINTIRRVITQKSAVLVYLNIPLQISLVIDHILLFYHGATTRIEPGPPHNRGFTISLIKTPLDE